MTIQLEAYQFIMILIAVLSTVVGTVKHLWGQIEKSLGQKFIAVDRELAEVNKEIRGLERRYHELNTHIALHYVAREDYIRGQTIIEAKLDAVAQKIEKNYSGR